MGLFKIPSQQRAAGFHPGLLSGLALAGANLGRGPNDTAIASGDDGILTALEIAALDLTDTDLVVLSACGTGRRKEAGGEGILELQQAFQVAGASSVVANLWKVDDPATQTLMGEFYQNLWQRGMTRAESLRHAQLTMLRCYDPQEQHLRDPGSIMTPPVPLVPANAAVPEVPMNDHLSPFYWAAFVLSGDWR